MNDYAATVINILIIVVAVVLLGELVLAIWRRYR